MSTPISECMPALQQRIPALAGLDHPLGADDFARLCQTIELAFWKTPDDSELLLQYQSLCRDWEKQRAPEQQRDRHHLFIVIPVADRPAQLQACLNSIRRQCECFGYGGQAEGRWHKIRVIVADDSRHPDARRQHQDLADALDAQGVPTHYFGQQEQQQLIGSLPKNMLPAVPTLLGNPPQSGYARKGASVMRNLTYLLLNQLQDQVNNPLFLFIDSDQEFRLPLPGRVGEKAVYACNYFLHLDRMFRAHDLVCLTGKVVGDPPVSPAVMAATCLDDIGHLLDVLAATDPRTECGFHGTGDAMTDDAAYHDMAALFGFDNAGRHYDYHCPLPGEHDHAACLARLGRRLNGFFDGEHPTRQTDYQPQLLDDSLKPARTVYTGNYVFTPEALNWAIPFAVHKLRMAGPTLGRILKARFRGRFVSANLPLLHKRTLSDSGEAECRPGIQRKAGQVDLGEEFIRQFQGDVMLFSIQKLTQKGYPRVTLDTDTIETVLQETHRELLDQYRATRDKVRQRLVELNRRFDSADCWWQQSDYQDIQVSIRSFLFNMHNNFQADAPHYRFIEDEAVWPERLHTMAEAIARYPREQQHWQVLLDRLKTQAPA